MCACSAISGSCILTDCSPQAVQSMGFPRQEHWSGLPYPSLQGIFPSQESNRHLLRLLHWQADSFTSEPPGKPPRHILGDPKMSVDWRSLACPLSVAYFPFSSPFQLIPCQVQGSRRRGLGTFSPCAPGVGPGLCELRTFRPSSLPWSDWSSGMEQ